MTGASAAPPTPRPELPVVLFVSYPAGLGGSARSLLTVLAGLEGRCHRVVARRPGTTVAEQIDRQGLAEQQVDLHGGRGAVNRLRDALTLGRWALGARHRLAVVHANGLSEAQVALGAGVISRRRVVVWVHDWTTTRNARFLARATAAIGGPFEWITVSAANRHVLEAEGLISASRVAVVANPIDLGSAEVLSPTASGTKVAFLGSPLRYKGFHLLPEIIGELARTHPAARWHLWSGPRTMLPEVWAALEGLGDPPVTVHPKTTTVAEAYQEADIVVCPSLEESFGRVAAEAMSAGVPVVASDLPALREVLGDAGTYFPAGDTRVAAAAVAGLLDDPKRRAWCSARGRERAAAFAPEPVVAELSRRYGLTSGDGMPGSALVVSHDASRTGAPRVATHVADALRSQGSRVEVLLRWPGPLSEALAQAGDRVTLEPLRRTRALTRPRPRLRGATLRLDERVAARVLARRRPDLVWCNTVLSSNYVRPALASGIPVVLHVHELGPLISGVLGRFALAAELPRVTLVAASAEAAEQIQATYGLPDGTVEVLESVIDTRAVVQSAARGRSLADTSRPIVGACGQADSRKGIDLWLDIAAAVHRERPEVRFVWIGRGATAYGDAARTRGLADVVQLFEEVADPAATMAEMDVFTLPSRFDTFPLVVLEAMALGRPCVAFDAGGAARQLGPAGVLVESGDVEGFAVAVVELLGDAARRQALGAQARRRVTAHFDVAPFAEKVAAIARSATAARR